MQEENQRTEKEIEQNEIETMDKRDDCSCKWNRIYRQDRLERSVMEQDESCHNWVHN